jgi:hypothetical protein
MKKKMWRNVFMLPHLDRGAGERQSVWDESQAGVTNVPASLPAR